MRALGQSTEQIVRLRDTVTDTDKYGDPSSAPATGELPIDGCLVAPLRSDEPTDRGRAGVVVGWTVFCPPGTDVQFTDRLRIRGVECEVQGEVADWGDAGVVVNATRATG